EMRLPGQGYERFNRLNSDASGRYGLVDQHKILGDVAPWSNEYRKVDSLVDSIALTPDQRSRVELTREQVHAKSIKNEFYPYEYKYSSASEMMKSPFEFTMGRLWEEFSHGDTYFNTK